MMSLLHDIRVISIHALAKRATTTARLFGYPLMISIHALAKRATSTATRRSSTCLFQSTPSQRGRLPAQRGLRLRCLISIHALAKRATEQALLKRALGYISIHALAKRATSINISSSDFFLYFNPRPRKEGDEPVKAIGFKALIFQSTPSQRGRHKS